MNYILENATKEKTSLMRLVWVSVYNATRYYHYKDRCIKPFNSMLGETFELVTPAYRMIAEQVSHHPPLSAVFL